MAAPMSRRTLVLFSGWIVAAVLLALIAPRAYKRWAHRLPFLREITWQQAMEERKAELRGPWQDSRPLIAFFGDSQVEMGRWYEDGAGAYAIRNGGLSAAEIHDVEELVSAVSVQETSEVLLLVGINDLARGQSVEVCLARYEKLLATVRDRLHPRRIWVLSVMPVQTAGATEDRAGLNRQAVAFNRALRELCGRESARFLDLQPAVADRDGGLRTDFSLDGLHLNPKGYRAISAVIFAALKEALPAS